MSGYSSSDSVSDSSDSDSDHSGSSSASGSNSSDSDSRASASSKYKSGHSKNSKGYTKVGDLKVYVESGLFFQQKVDAIVNSSVQSLDLSRGRSSKALLDAAGQIIQSDIQKKYPKGIHSGDIAITKAGKLSCSKVFHCALPKYSGSKEEKILADVVKKCLKEADRCQFTSIAFPPLGAGYLGFPADRVAETMMDTIEDFQPADLDSVHIVIYHKDQATLKAFTNAFGSKQHKSKGSATKSATKSKGGAKASSSSHRPHGKGNDSVGSISVEIEVGELENTKADVIVFNAQKNLDLRNGGLGSKILQAAGPKIQKDIRDDYPYDVSYGDVAIVDGHNLPCRQVYIGALPQWGVRSPNPEHILNEFIERCLEEANERRVKTMAFSTIGIGSLNYPYDTVARAMMDNLEKFDRRFDSHLLHSVSIVIFQGHKDVAKIQKAFEKELKAASSSSGSAKFVPSAPASFSAKSSCSKKYGNTTVNVVIDQMATQKVDVIVNSTAPSLNLKSSSGLSSSLLKAGGSQIQSELDKKYAKGIEPGDIAVTSGGSLSCKAIYHGTLPYWYSKKKRDKKPEEVIESFVHDCLTKASKDGHRSIAFPALGTGYQKFPPEQAAHHIMLGIQSSCGKSSPISEIRIVIYGGGAGYQNIEKAFVNELTGRAVQQVQNAQPPRGSPAFFKWMYMQTAKPPHTWTHFTSKKTLRDWYINLSGNPCKEVTPDQTTYKSVEAAFVGTMRGLLSSPRVVSIKRIENVELFLKYSDESQRLFKKAAVNGACKPLDKLPQSAGRSVILMKYLDPVLAQQLYPEINEFYFFHGTQAQVVNIIKSQGLDSRLANSGRVGAGVYGAEVASKSAQYVAPSQNGHSYMFIIRMCLGDVFVTHTGGNYRRPPCKHCSNTRCTTHAELFDSIMADGPQFMDREFIVYDKNQCYPEFLIEYK